jgi:hypothetical protein
LISYYKEEEWIERRKRKQLVRKELDKIKPTLQLFDENGEFLSKKWKKLKKDYNVKSAMMQIFLEALGEEFSSTKQTQNKNRTIEQLSPYAKEFLRIFLKQKKPFIKSTSWAFFLPYDGMSIKL